MKSSSDNFRIDFTDVFNITVDEMIDKIMNMEGLPMREISKGILAKSSSVFDTSIFEWNGQAAYGTGIYVFKKEDANGKSKPIYVGIAPNNFLDRFYGHMNTKYRQHWGWNAMLQCVASGILQLPLTETRGQKNKLLSNPSLEQALDWMKDSKLVMIDFNPEDYSQMKLRYRFETIVTKGMKYIDDSWMKQKMRNTYTDAIMMRKVSDLLS